MFVQLLAFRLVNALVVNTYFSADEYYQSVEVAHKHVFDHHMCNDKLTWEWQPEHALRGYLHPMIFTILYSIMKYCGITQADLYVIAPRLLQSISSAICDYSVHQLATKWFHNNKSVAFYALVASVTNWFHFYCGVRTFSNSLETTITVVAVLFYPYYPMSCVRTSAGGTGKRSEGYWLFFAGLGCVLRPTSAIIWAPLFVFQLFDILSTSGIAHMFRFCIRDTVPYVVFWLGSSVLLDSYMYGKPTFVVLNFLKFNVFENRSHLYGVQPWHWYFSQGFPVISFAQFPFFVIALGVALLSGFKTAQNRPLLLIVFVLVTYSVFAHKEFRFIYPILPLSFVYVGKIQSEMLPTRRTLKRFIIAFVIALQVLMAFYFSQIHQRGTIAATAELRNKSDVTKVYYLIPCHHAPSYSHLYNYNSGTTACIKHLDCSPCFGDCTNYEEEQDIFYRDPETFLNETFKHESLPSHIVMYEDLATRVQSFLTNNKYRQTDRLFHMHLPHVHDKRMSEHVLIFEGTKV